MFDPTKPIQTRDGRSARIICMDRDHVDGNIVALVKSLDGPHEGEENIFTYYSDGRYAPAHSADQFPSDLINVPEYWYRNIYSDPKIPSLWNDSRRITPVQDGGVIGYLRAQQDENGNFINIEFFPDNKS